MVITIVLFFFCDISKAFDSLCYNGLIHKLNLKYVESLNQFRNGLLAFSLETEQERLCIKKIIYGIQKC